MKTKILAGSLIVVFGLLALLLMIRWNAQTEPVFDTRPHKILSLSLLHFYGIDNDSGLTVDTMRCRVLFGLSSWIMRHFGVSYANIMTAQYPFFLLMLTCLAGIAWMIRGPLAAVIAAAFAAFMPATYIWALVFDDHLHNMAVFSLITLLFTAFFRWKRTIYLLPAFIFGLFLLNNTQIASTSIVLYGGICFFSLGMMLAVVTESVRFSGGKIVVWRKMALIPFLLLFLAAIYLLALKGLAADKGVDYYVNEAAWGNRLYPNLDWNSVFTYSTFMLYDLLGPLQALLLLLGLTALFLFRIEERLPLVFWLFGLVVALSFVPKKNPYYIYSAVLAAPVIVGVGLAALREKRALFFCGIALLIAGMVYTFVGLHDRLPPNPLEKNSSAYFQTPAEFLLQPPLRQADPFEAEAEKMIGSVFPRQDSFSNAYFIFFGEWGETDGVRYYLLLHAPGAKLWMLDAATSFPPPGKNVYFIQYLMDNKMPLTFTDAVDASWAKRATRIRERQIDGLTLAKPAILTGADSFQLCHESKRMFVYCYMPADEVDSIQ